MKKFFLNKILPILLLICLIFLSINFKNNLDLNKDLSFLKDDIPLSEEEKNEIFNKTQTNKNLNYKKSLLYKDLYIFETIDGAIEFVYENLFNDDFLKDNKMEFKIKVDNMNNEEIINEIIYKDGFLQGISNFYILKSKSSNLDHIILSIDRDIYPKDTLIKLFKDVDKIVSENILIYSKDLEKAEAILNYISPSVFDNREKFIYDPSDLNENNNPISAHFKGISKCQGYSNYICLIARKSGLDTNLILSESLNHAWIKWNIDDLSYGSDITLAIRNNRKIYTDILNNKFISTDNYINTGKYLILYFSYYDIFEDTIIKVSNNLSNIKVEDIDKTLDIKWTVNK